MISPRADGGGLPLPPSALYRTLCAWLRGPVARLFSLSVEGLEHLPTQTPYIIAANHHNYLDGVILALTVPQPIAFMVMPRVYRATRLHPLFHDRIGSIPLTLERGDVGALRRALGVLREGRVVGIFPEGPFSVHGRLERGLPGVALLALRSGVPVVPAGIRGTYEALAGRRCYIPRRHPLRVRFGSPRRFTAEPHPRRLTRAKVTQRIMQDIAGLLGD
ncbi:MAG: lysophospholipid acyltransferase family protein [Candidatus Rokuibacteriota bacterium]